MTETKDYDTPTVSEREAVKRERRAYQRGRADEREVRIAPVRKFLGGAWPDPVAYGMAEQTWQAEVYEAAHHAYPLPKRQRPLRVTLSGGSIWSVACDGKMVCHGPKNSNDPTHYPIVVETWRAASNLATAEDCEKFARCLRGELEDVPDDE